MDGVILIYQVDQALGPRQYYSLEVSKSYPIRGLALDEDKNYLFFGAWSGLWGTIELGKLNRETYSR
jgi:hypothetical protein